MPPNIAIRSTICQSSAASPASTSKNTPPVKPPRPTTAGSLDRRQTRHTSTNRQERDSKSRSTHSLKEKSLLLNEYKVSPCSSNNSQNSKGRNFPVFNSDSSSTNISRQKKINFPSDQFKGNQDSGYQPQDANYFNNSNNTNHHYSRSSPAFWEPPPPPPPPGPWEHYYNYQNASREELRMLEYHRRQLDLYRYGSNSALGSTSDLYQNTSTAGCCPYRPPMPLNPHHTGCCTCEHKPQLSWNGVGNQV